MVITNDFKEVVFIIAHMIGFKEISARSKSNNLYFDLSAFYWFFLIGWIDFLFLVIINKDKQLINMILEGEG